MVYGRRRKAIRKARRYHKRSSRYRRHFKSSRYRKRAFRRFKRKVNACGEKKMVQFAWDAPLSFLGAGTTGLGIIQTNYPDQGVDGDERIGKKVFIRYVKLVVNVCPSSNEIQNGQGQLVATRVGHNWGHIGFFLCKEKREGILATTTLNDIVPNGRYFNGFDDALIKTKVSKVRNLTKYVRQVSILQGQQNPPVDMVADSCEDRKFTAKWTIKLKVMKEVQLQSEGDTKINIPDWYLYMGYFSHPYSQVTNYNDSGADIIYPSQVYISMTTTFTDM